MAKKNKDETMQRLIDAVGTILRDKGHKELGVNKIALEAGVSKELIYRYFTSLNNLLKDYIAGRDYWQPLLKEMVAGEQDVLQMFIELLQNQFKYFFEEKEMQRFILWQISEYNTLMRSISEERESDGAKLLAMTNAHFKGSGVNFRAVMALLLGGIYYVVLHGENNKSTVAGIDVNLEKDREAILLTIAQVLGWAWDAAKQTK